jgi:hypothetical protein
LVLAESDAHRAVAGGRRPLSRALERLFGCGFVRSLALHTRPRAPESTRETTLSSPAPSKPFSDPDFAKEASQKAAEARRRKAQLVKAPPDEQIQANLPSLVAALLDAALGKGDFDDLKASDRLKALQTALAYGLGRPGAREKAEEGPEAPTASTLFGVPAPE